MTESGLPAADLGARLRRRIAATGPISIADFMAEALYHPTFGVYAAGDPIGASGDFITAPEISQMFGELLGLWCADTWLQMGRPDPVALVELGPGHGTLMHDALRAIERAVPAFAQAATVHLVEISPSLRARQQALLGGRVPPPHWHDDLATVPALPALVIANEVFDALPVRQYQRSAAGWCERLVYLDPEADPGAVDGGSGLRFGLGAPLPAEAARALLPASLLDAPVGSVIERSPAALGLARALAERLVASGGAALIVDYGYLGPSTGETLQAVRAHRPVPMLAAPGRADLTAHVDFTAVTEAARGAGAAVFGPLGQGPFLTRLGIDARTAALARTADERQRAALEAGRKRLIETDQMGTLFKVLCVCGRGAPVVPAGFDPSERLGP